MTNAHENIDNEIIANTLQEIAHTQRGEGMDLFYKLLTKHDPPEDRYIHLYQPTSGNIDERDNLREWRANMLRNQLEQNPAFSDTISYKEGMKKLAPQEGILKTLLKALGY